MAFDGNRPVAIAALGDERLHDGVPRPAESASLCFRIFLQKYADLRRANGYPAFDYRRQAK
jgi:hypothetical protein